MMPKRSEKRNTAKADYIARKARGEKVNLRELADALGYDLVWQKRRDV